MPDCLNCPKCWSGKCRNCAAHQAELAEYFQDRIHELFIRIIRPLGENPPNDEGCRVFDRGSIPHQPVARRNATVFVSPFIMAGQKKAEAGDSIFGDIIPPHPRLPASAYDYRMQEICSPASPPNLQSWQPLKAANHLSAERKCRLAYHGGCLTRVARRILYKHSPGFTTLQKVNKKKVNEMKTHRLKENVRVRSLLVEKAGTAPRNNVSSKNIEVSVYGALSKIYEFYPAVLEEIPQAAQVRIDPQLGMVYKIPAVKQTEFEELARQHELALTGVGEVMA